MTEDLIEAFRALAEQQVREANSRNRSDIAIAVWARRKASLRRSPPFNQD